MILDFRHGGIERSRHRLVHLFRLLAFDEIGRVTVSAEQRLDLVVRNAGQHGGSRYLVTVQMQNRQHSPIASRIQKLVGVPAPCEWTSFGFTITHNANGQ